MAKNNLYVVDLILSSAAHTLPKLIGGSIWDILDIRNPPTEPFPECFLPKTGFCQMT